MIRRMVFFTTHASLLQAFHRLFNELTGSARPPQADFRRLLVAPTNMLDRFLALIAREADHARRGEGRGGRIPPKIYGPSRAGNIRARFGAPPGGVAVALLLRRARMLGPGGP